MQDYGIEQLKYFYFGKLIWPTTNIIIYSARLVKRESCWGSGTPGNKEDDLTQDDITHARMLYLL